jgi:O-antigen/teichoic acid export membrane protein
MIVVLVRVFNMGLVGVVGSMVVANSITSAYLMLKSGIIRYISISRLSWYMIKEMIAYSWPLIPNNLSSWIMTLSDRLILAFFWGVEANAVYAVTKKIPNLLTTVQNPFSLAWHENASLSAEDSDIDEYYSSMFDKVFNIVFGACAVLIGISPILFSLLIRGEYAEAYSQMPVLFLATTFLSLSSYLAGIYIADKRTKEIGTTTTIAAIINLIIDLIAIPFIGTWAASISTLVSYVFLFVYRLIDLKKFHNIHYKYAKMCFSISVLVLLSFLSSFNNRWLNGCVLLVGLIIAIMFNQGFIKSIIEKITK